MTVSLPDRPRAVLLDYCGVLARPASAADFRRLAAMAGAEPARFRSAYWRHRLGYDRDAVDFRTYWRTVGADCGVDLTDRLIDQLVELDIAAHTAVRPSFARRVAEWAEAGVPIGVLSNLPAELARRVRAQPEWRPVRAWAFSCDLRLAKPDPRAFSSALRLLGSTRDQTLFVDDRVENIRAAEQAGLAGLLWSDRQV